ncbi:MAG: PIN domain-containing protein [Deltaproteobacteria bacterium]|nr:PIN domain-containing protein [Deltaproteobacteria bacterium]
MIAIDTNLLVYAHREDSLWYEAAYASIKGLAEGRTPWAIPWPCLYEFFSIVTHPRIYNPPTPMEKAIDQVEAWLESPSLILLSESTEYWTVLRDSILTGKVSGPLVHDARVAALCRHHGVRTLWSADRDFSRFPGLTVRNPLVG